MAAAQKSTTVEQIIQLKSGRTPLKPKNCFINDLTNSDSTKPKTKPNNKWIQISLIQEFNKENHPMQPNITPTKIESLDSSLAEELTAMRKKLERLRLDKEKTDKILEERSSLLDKQMKDLENRNQIQKTMEMEVDRLYRLNELKSYCMRISPIRSLRDREIAKIKNTDEAYSQGKTSVEESIGENEDMTLQRTPLREKLITQLQLDDEAGEESIGENEHISFQSPTSSCSESSVNVRK